MKTNKLALLTIVLVLVQVDAFAALSAVGPVIPYNAAAHTGKRLSPIIIRTTTECPVDIQVPPSAYGQGLLPPTLIFATVGSNPLNSSYTPAMIQFSTDMRFRCGMLLLLSAARPDHFRQRSLTPVEQATGRLCGHRAGGWFCHDLRPWLAPLWTGNKPYFSGSALFGKTLRQALIGLPTLTE